jgi:hypothetical protein
MSHYTLNLVPICELSTSEKQLQSVIAPLTCSVQYLVRFEVLTPVTMDITVFWDMTPCIVVVCLEAAP